MHAEIVQHCLVRSTADSGDRQQGKNSRWCFLEMNCLKSFALFTFQSENLKFLACTCISSHKENILGVSYVMPESPSVTASASTATTTSSTSTSASTYRRSSWLEDKTPVSTLPMTTEETSSSSSNSVG